VLVTLGHTPNFNIQYDNKLKDGKRRAKALKSTCEADFAQLRSWFTAIDVLTTPASQKLT
jgi:hypothetical protein